MAQARDQHVDAAVVGLGTAAGHRAPQGIPGNDPAPLTASGPPASSVAAVGGNAARTRARMSFWRTGLGTCSVSGGKAAPASPPPAIAISRPIERSSSWVNSRAPFAQSVGRYNREVRLVAGHDLAGALGTLGQLPRSQRASMPRKSASFATTRIPCLMADQDERLSLSRVRVANVFAPRQSYRFRCPVSLLLWRETRVRRHWAINWGCKRPVNGR